MTILDPNKALRLAHIEALEPLGVPAYEESVPIDVIPLPEEFILLSGQINSRRVVNKYLWEWNCSLVIDIQHAQPLGFTSGVRADELAAMAVSRIEDGLSVDGFRVKSKELQDLATQNFNTPEKSVNRRLIRYLYWLNRSVTL